MFDERDGTVNRGRNSITFLVVAVIVVVVVLFAAGMTLMFGLNVVVDDAVEPRATI